MSTTLKEALTEIAHGTDGLCATIEVSGEAEKWIQVTKDSLNACYPYSTEPSIELGARMQQPWIAGFSGWEAGSFVTLDITDPKSPDLIPWIEGYFISVLRCLPGQFTLNVRVEEL